MKVLCIGDIIASGGCEFLRKHLTEIKRQNEVDFIIANGENSADGNGITPYSADYLFASGVDVITTGNHVFKRKEALSLLENESKIIRPANFWGDVEGYGYYIADLGRARIAIINLIGTIFMEPANNPFFCVDKLLSKIDADFVFVDIHAEATSEKQALAYFLDGRVSAVFGTHTHVQTNDSTILPKGTGLITDIGMVGSQHSVLGILPECVISKFTKSQPVKFEAGKSPMKLNSVLFEIDEKSHKCVDIRCINIFENSSY